MHGMERSHVPGIELSRRFYREVVQPLLNHHFGPLPHTAALIGTGSEVLGLDTERSTDHDWGPRLLLFLRPDDTARHGEAIDAMLTERQAARARPHRRPRGDGLARAVRDLPLTGTIDQCADSTDVVAHRTRSRLLTTALCPPRR
jgi:hypothetical protein